MAGEIKQMRADFAKGQKDLFSEIRELKEAHNSEKESHCCVRVCQLY